MFGAVLDRAEEEFELGAELRDAGGGMRCVSFESFERLVQPALEVLLEVAGCEDVLLGRLQRLSSLGRVEDEGLDLTIEELGIAHEAD